MWKYCLNKIAELISVLILISFFSFSIIYYAPGDVSNMYITMDMTDDEIAAVRNELGVDRSMGEQYIDWVSKLLQGNLGVSYANRMEVAPQIMSRLPATFLLMGTSMIFSLLIAIPLGLLSGYKKNKKIDNLISCFLNIGMSVPSFLVGIILIVIFAGKLHVLPVGGMNSAGNTSITDTVKHLILPCVTLSMGSLVTYSRYIRTNTITQLNEEYILTAEAKGTSEWNIMFKHVLKNTLLPVVTLIGMHLPSFVCGSFIVETVFGWPGAGTYAMTAVKNRDYPIIMAYVMMSGFLLVVGNFVVDIIYGFLDPRIKRRNNFGK